MLFVWGGVALAVLQIPGGGAPLEFTKLGDRLHARRRGSRPALVILVAVVVLVWLPIRRRSPGSPLYAIGSNRNAAYLTGVNVARDADRRLRARRQRSPRWAGSR